MSTLEVKAIQAPTGYNLAMPAGHILQVVSADYVTEGNSTSTSFVSIGLTATITPSTTSSKIIILASPTVWGDRTGNAENLTKLAIYKGSSILADSETGVRTYDRGGSGIQIWGKPAMNYVDSPSTTSATTYTVYGKAAESGITFAWNPNDGGGSHSNIILMEVAG
jgi:hypothetical protein